MQNFQLLTQLLCVSELARALSLVIALVASHKKTDGSLIVGHLSSAKTKLQIL